MYKESDLPWKGQFKDLKPVVRHSSIIILEPRRRHRDRLSANQRHEEEYEARPGDADHGIRAVKEGVWQHGEVH
jgi:hypothetical protein